MMAFHAWGRDAAPPIPAIHRTAHARIGYIVLGLLEADGGIAMGQLIRLLSPKTARAFHYWMTGIWAFAAVFVGDVNLDRFQRWFWSTPQQQQQILQENPELSEKIETLFVEYQHHMDTQYQVSAIRRELLTLPALPDEGY
jgi:hypothetical protein